jgi:major membrane immunogen (membrane-anchored lipoprotein)
MEEKKRMKKFITLFFAMLMLFVVTSCGDDYKFDGDFTAFEVSETEIYVPGGNSYNAAQVTFVTVKVKDGKVVSYNLDERQSTIVDGNLVWNTKTKKELKYDYGMKGSSEIEKEWFEQAAVIEQQWLDKGVDSIKTDDDGYIDGLAGATMVDTNYSKLAKEALSNAKKGLSIAFEVTVTDIFVPGGNNYDAAQITFVAAQLKGKKVTSFNLDERQSTIVDGNLVWNAKTKKELKFDYGMKGSSEIEKEWFEQAAVIEKQWLDGGVDSIKTDDEGYIDDLAGATMVDSNYSKLAKEALKKVGL